MKLKLFLIILSACLFSSCSPKTEDYDVYLLIGQSNMAGRGLLSEDDCLSTIDSVWLLDASGQPEPASAPLNKYSTIRKSLKMQGMNPGFEFSKEMRTKTGRKILLVCNARGGTSLNQWMPDAPADTTIAPQNFFNEAVARARKAMKFGQLKAILWHQGESDSSHPDTYMGKLEVMVSRLRAELGDEEARIPFIAGEIAPWHGNHQIFNPVLNSISRFIPNSGCVSSEGCTWLKNEKDPHFSREGQLLLGHRYAELTYDMLYEN